MKYAWADDQERFLAVVVERKPAALAQLIAIAKLDPEEQDAAAEAWARAWHLNAPWCAEKARVMSEKIKAAPYWVTPFEFADGGRHRLFETREEWEAKVRSAFDTTLADYLEADARADGPTTPDTMENPEHRTWLVRYQVEKESYESIAKSVRSAEKPTISHQTIMYGVKKLANDLGLKLREQVGAPKRETSLSNKRKTDT